MSKATHSFPPAIVFILVFFIFGIGLVIVNSQEIVSIFSGQELSREVARTISSHLDSPSELLTHVQFTIKSGDYADTQIIAEELNSIRETDFFTPEMFCLSKGDYETSSDFSFSNTNETVLIFNGNPVEITFTVACNSGNQLVKIIQNYDFTSSWMNSKGCQQIAQSDKTGCVTAFRRLLRRP